MVIYLRGDSWGGNKTPLGLFTGAISGKMKKEKKG